MLCAELLPKLGANLVATLAGLKRDDLAGHDGDAVSAGAQRYSSETQPQK
jgi:hypothetical protein